MAASRTTWRAGSGSARASTRSSGGPSRRSGTPDAAWRNEAAGSGDFDIVAAYEAMARAHLTEGDLEQVAARKAKATAALVAIADKDDRQIIEGDLATRP